MDYEQLLRAITVMNKGEIDIFLGAGASVTSGIPTGGDLVWYFKKKIYCDTNKIHPNKFKDLYLPSVQDVLQGYFDKKGGYPCLWSPEEYSHYFQECFPTSISRQQFIDSKVSSKNPSLGYLCLAVLLSDERFKNVWTTNFDSLAETAFHIIEPLKNILVCSSANSSSIQNFNTNYPCICKLHGDFRYDTLKNTTDELKSLENSLHNFCHQSLNNRGVLFVGYSGNDDSIMTFMESHISESNFLSKGLYWAIVKGTAPNARVVSLVNTAKSHGKVAEIIEIESFDDLLYDLYQKNGKSHTLIDEQWKKRRDSKSILSFRNSQSTYFTKLNSYSIDQMPTCRVFKTDITRWKQLRECIGNNRIIAALYNGCVYSFDDENKIKDIFNQHIKSEVTIKTIDTQLLRKHDSIYIGMLYDLIKYDLLAKGLICYKRNKYYNPQKFINDKGNCFYEAVEISIEYINGKLNFFILPTIHALKSNGGILSKENYQFLLNQKISQIYNKEYNEKLQQWERLFLNNKRLLFKYDSVELSFHIPAISSGGTNRNPSWLELPSYSLEEPIMCFSGTDENKTSINQLKGLVQYGPIDFSYLEKDTIRPSIKLSILSPKESLKKILLHLNSLNLCHRPTYDAFLPDYNGFSQIYKRELSIPDETDRELCKTYPTQSFLGKPAEEYLDFLKRGIDYFAKKVFDFDILIIYIPQVYSDFREAKSISEDFNLHDAIKMYATEKGVAVQFIEEKSLNTTNHCKVVWGLSTSLYAKSQGVLWHPKAIHEGTAYIGIGYAKSDKKGICIGCSQLFDSTGTGVRMILKKIKKPKFYGKQTPYMGKDEAREMMIALREKYYHCCPTSKIERVVIHKTTPFMSDEIIGITQAFEGVEIDLIQIQEYSPWRGIRFGLKAEKEAYGYSMKRGTAIRISDDSFLLWSHGCVTHDSLAGSNKNYYKNSRGIPTPLLIKKYYGQGNADTISNEILMLTKMNWNSGDSLYKVLPVTLDFAKVLSRMSKQEEAVYDKAYDFRYFM